MNLYIIVDPSDIAELDNVPCDDIAAWVSEQPAPSFIEIAGSPTTQNHPIPGIRISVNKAKDLKDSVNFLYKIAKAYKCHFVVGIEDDTHGQREDICYFGHEEGKPDIFEMACYLGLVS